MACALDRAGVTAMMRPDLAATPLLPLVPPPTSEGLRGKPVARRAMLACRDGVPAHERATASARIADRVIARWPSYFERGSDLIVALYAPKGSEVDTGSLDVRLRAQQITVAYPRVVGDHRRLAFCVSAPDELVSARFGLREPAPHAPELDLADIAIFFVPGLGFDRYGGRIGWGRGHYDATLAAAPAALRVGLAFDCQLIDHVPREPHDALLHHVVTELAIYDSPPLAS
jgi:5-formyltetrahydrofolate cyclo-ligase